MGERREFTWDEAKAASNLGKHGVSFAYATRAFLDPGRVELDATRPDDREVRRKVIGAIEGRVFAVVYTERHGGIRIISARRCNAQEGKAYGAVYP